MRRVERTRRETRRGLLLAAPGATWIAGFLALPMLLILGISFFSVGEYGEVQ
jgi:ABC-type sugar transport system permease subunit